MRRTRTLEVQTRDCVCPASPGSSPFLRPVRLAGPSQQVRLFYENAGAREAEVAAIPKPYNLPAPPSAAHLAVHVGNTAVALGGSVELADLAHTEALGELLPDGRPQPVAHGQAHAVPPLGLAHRLLQQVPADLPDVLDHLGGGGGARGGPEGSLPSNRGAKNKSVLRAMQQAPPPKAVYAYPLLNPHSGGGGQKDAFSVPHAPPPPFHSPRCFQEPTGSAGRWGAPLTPHRAALSPEPLSDAVPQTPSSGCMLRAASRSPSCPPGPLLLGASLQGSFPPCLKAPLLEGHFPNTPGAYQSSSLG